MHVSSPGARSAGKCDDAVVASPGDPTRLVCMHDGALLFTTTTGSGPASVVALHGGPAASSLAIRDDLAPLATGRRLIFYDQRGSGQSAFANRQLDVDIKHHVADLDAVRAAFTLEKLMLLGHSWGGVLAMYYATEHPDRVERIVLLSPGSPTKALSDEASDSIDARLTRFYSPADYRHFLELSDAATWTNAEKPRDICREYYRMLLAVYTDDPSRLARRKGTPCGGIDETIRQQPATAAAILASLGDYNLIPKLARVTAPVLVVYGESDPIPLASAEAWAKALPNARLLVIKQAGHFPHVEQPEGFFAAVETFLGGGWPADARDLHAR